MKKRKTKKRKTGTRSIANTLSGGERNEGGFYLLGENCGRMLYGITIEDSEIITNVSRGTDFILIKLRQKSADEGLQSAL